MNTQPSSAIENGFTAQLINSVTEIPRQCFVTWPSAPKSIFISIGMIISQISAATGQRDVLVEHHIAAGIDDAQVA